MKHTIFLLLLCLCFSVKGNGQDTTGVGVGQLQVSLNSTIFLYRTFEDSIPDLRMKFGRITDVMDRNKGRFTLDFDGAEELNPLTLYLGDSDYQAMSNINHGLTYFAPELIFRVLEVRGNAYRVVLNEDSFEQAVIRLNRFTHILYTEGKSYWAMRHNSSERDKPWLLYESWGDYMKRIRGVHVKQANIFSEPEGKSIKELKKPANFVVDSVNGNWIRVSELNNHTNVIGWLKWTDGEKILINFLGDLYY